MARRVARGEPWRRAANRIERLPVRQPVRPEKPRAIAVTVFPLSPVSIEEAVRSGLFTGCGLNRAAYERRIGELPK